VKRLFKGEAYSHTGYGITIFTNPLRNYPKVAKISNAGLGDE
jgi:hypothetical protein